MRKEDFHKGQTVYLYDLRDRRKYVKTEDKIKPAEVITVGRSYISVNLYSRIYRFEIARNFRQVSDYSPSYSLHLSKYEIYSAIKDNKERMRIQMAFDATNNLICRLSEEDKQVILSIVDKYETEASK